MWSSQLQKLMLLHPIMEDFIPVPELNVDEVADLANI